MTSSKNVQNTHMSEQLRSLHSAMLDIHVFMNQARNDEMLIREANIPLDRALFPLLVAIERFGPIGIVDLADRVGRDYTTVSRQVAKLVSLGLTERRGSAADGRVREAIISAKGEAITRALDAARQRLAGPIFATWEAEEIESLARLMRKLADALASRASAPEIA